MINRKKPRNWGFSLLLVRLTGFEFTDHFLNCLFLLPPSDAVSVALAFYSFGSSFGSSSSSTSPLLYWAVLMQRIAPRKVQMTVMVAGI